MLTIKPYRQDFLRALAIPSNFFTLYTGNSRVKMSPAELKMQPTIHLQSKAEQYPGLLCKYIVSCTFNSVELINTREIPLISFLLTNTFFHLMKT
jgi:hypothetical protein